MSRDTLILGEVRPGPLPRVVLTQTEPLDERILELLRNRAEKIVVDSAWYVVDDALRGRQSMS